MRPPHSTVTLLGLLALLSPAAALPVPFLFGELITQECDRLTSSSDADAGRIIRARFYPLRNGKSPFEEQPEEGVEALCSGG
ncbi:hypothetical protein CALCODRAFT_479702 [Calocera cornea HHB12733]|uniref:Uncharacterized protein n=1 Tax=Calocera cornea HHB12733 TaxID=1353952 RepID=A0A165JCP0_9BASI|nr:hypothetical protein CALCODRAFT_479702 [Calocera cornea HHB12733]